MALELGERVKLLDEYMETLKQDLLFLMAEQRKQRPGTSNMHQKIITIKRELDKAAQDRMRLVQIHHGNINSKIALSAIGR